MAVSPDLKKITLPEADLKAALEEAWNDGYKAAALKLDPEVKADLDLIQSSEREKAFWQTGAVIAGGSAILAVAILILDFTLRK